MFKRPDPGVVSNRAVRTTSLGGFTLLETIIVCVIVAIVASIGLTKFDAALEASRMVKAKATLKVIAFEVDSYRVRNGAFPRSLDDVGEGNRMDPWGNPYIYLNFQTGTGSAVKFASEGGLIDPAAFEEPSKPSVDDGENDPDAVAEFRRTDQFLFPLNTDYDLFCLGPNGRAFASLVEEFSLDDVIRANDGGYYGPASLY